MKSVLPIIAQELEIFEKKFAQAVKGDTPALDQVLKYIIKRKGKQLRPMFVFLCARLHGPVNESTYRAAALVEMLHTATLVHDDVVDESYERRGFFSINAIWKNKIAVLVGDYLLSKGLILSTENNDFMHLHLMSEAVKKMSEGELLQIQKSRRLNLNEDIYFEIIQNKTASLLASACSIGAWSTTQDADITSAMKSFGEKVGIAFQIKDDLFDYGHEAVGKPLGNDIQEKKLTLPLIYALNHVSPDIKRKMIYIIKNQNRNRAKINELIAYVTEAGGINYAINKMEAYRDEALSILHQYTPSPERTALEDLVRYTTDRKY